MGRSALMSSLEYQIGPDRQRPVLPFGGNKNFVRPRTLIVPPNGNNGGGRLAVIRYASWRNRAVFPSCSWAMPV